MDEDEEPPLLVEANDADVHIPSPISQALPLQDMSLVKVPITIVTGRIVIHRYRCGY